MFMQQGTSHPWSCIPIDRAYSTYLIFLIKDHFLRDVQQKPSLGEFCVLRGTQISLIIFSECTAEFMDAVMNIPDRCVGVDPLHFVLLWATKFLSHVFEDVHHIFDIGWRYSEIVREQSWTKGTLTRSRNLFPRGRV